MNRPTTPLFGFHLRLGHCPALPSPPCPARAGHECEPLSWALSPFSTSGPAGPLLRAAPSRLRHWSRVCLARFVPAAGFGNTLSPVFSPQGRAGLVSCRRRSWDLPFGAFSSAKGTAALSSRVHPHTVFLPRSAQRRIERPARGRRGFRGLTLWRSPSRTNACLAQTPPDAPLGFPAFQGTPTRTLPGISPLLLPRAWRRSGVTAEPRMRLRVSIGPRSAPSATRRKRRAQDAAAFLGFVRRAIPGIRAAVSSGLCVHLSPRRALPPTGPTSFG
jgi:hypothetical protein